MPSKKGSVRSKKGSVISKKVVYPDVTYRDRRADLTPGNLSFYEPIECSPGVGLTVFHLLFHLAFPFPFAGEWRQLSIAYRSMYGSKARHDDRSSRLDSKERSLRAETAM